MTRYFQAACFGIAMLFASCKKDVQPIPVAEVDSAPKVKEVKKCELSRIISYDPTFFTQTIVFEYNQKGDPVSVTPTVIGTGTPQLEFRYDNKGRLTDWIGRYSALSGGGFEFWHKYGHNSKGQIIKDTGYVWGLYAQGPTSAMTVGYAEYEYDKDGRIIKYTARSLNNPPGTNTYSYDFNGNLVTPGAVYDDQVSIFRTSEVWMFIHQNYSKNNALAATSYNSSGLPLQYNAPITPVGTAFRYMFRGSLLNRATIEYNCKGN